MKIRSILALVLFSALVLTGAFAETNTWESYSLDELRVVRQELNLVIADRMIQEKAVESDPEDFLYASNGEEIHIKKYFGSEPVIVIPEIIDGCPVTAVDDMAFMDNLSVTSVTFPSKLASIGESCFKNCSALSTIVFSEDMLGNLEIKDSAFSGCKSLTTVQFPHKTMNSLKIRRNAFGSVAISGVLVLNAKSLWLGNSCFRSCKSVTDVILLADNILFQDNPIPSNAYSVYMSPKATVDFDGYYINSKDGEVFADMAKLETLCIADSCAFFTKNTFANTPNVVLYAREGAQAIENVKPYFIPVNKKYYEQRADELLDKAYSLGYVYTAE